MPTLSSPVKEIVDFWEWWELALARRWTDGLVVAPPAESRVPEIIDYLGGAMAFPGIGLRSASCSA